MSTETLTTQYPNTTAEMVGGLLEDFGVRSMDIPGRVAMAAQAAADGITDEDVTILRWWFEQFEEEHGPMKSGGYIAKVMSVADAWRSVLSSARRSYTRKRATLPYPNLVEQNMAERRTTLDDWEVGVYYYLTFDCCPRGDVPKTAAEFGISEERVVAIRDREEASRAQA